MKLSTFIAAIFSFLWFFQLSDLAPQQKGVVCLMMFFFTAPLFFTLTPDGIKSIHKQSTPQRAVYFALWILTPTLLHAFAFKEWDLIGLAKVYSFIVVFCLLTLIASKKKQLDELVTIILLLIVWGAIQFNFFEGLWQGVMHLGSSFATLMAFNLLIFSISFRNTPAFAFHFKFNKNQLKTILLAAIATPIILTPIGFAADFIVLAKEFRYINLAAVTLGGFLMIALPEELFFRGILQEKLTQLVPKPWIAILLISVLFGLSHFNTPQFGGTKFIIVSGFAGILYGLSYFKTRSVTAAAIVHSVTNGILACFFDITP